MIWARKVHLYLSIFFTPLLVLFIVTGWWQTAAGGKNKVNGFAQEQLEKLSAVHVEQHYPVDGVDEYRTTPFEQLTVALCVGLLVTILMGLLIALQSSKNRKGAVVALLLGIAVPVGLLWYGVGKKSDPLKKSEPKHEKAK